MRRLLSIVSMGLLLCGAAGRAQDEPKSDIPPALQKYVDTVERLEHYEQLIHRHGWKESYSQDFAASAIAKLTIIEPQLHPMVRRQYVRTTTVDNHSAMSVMANQFERMVIEIGPKVSGDYALEMLVRSDGPFPNDLSFFTNGFESGPGFQFGGYANTRNILWYGKEGEEGKEIEGNIDGSTARLIQAETFHRVRLEVRGGEVAGLVDGQIVARHAMGSRVDRNAPRQPIFYVFRSSATLAEYCVEKPDDSIKAMDPEAAWKESFLRTTRDAVQSQLTELGQRLSDPDSATRRSAMQLMRRAGPAVEPALRQLIQSDSLEGRERARLLLNELGTATAK